MRSAITTAATATPSSRSDSERAETALGVVEVVVEHDHVGMQRPAGVEQRGSVTRLAHDLETWLCEEGATNDLADHGVTGRDDDRDGIVAHGGEGYPARTDGCEGVATP